MTKILYLDWNSFAGEYMKEAWTQAGITVVAFPFPFNKENDRLKGETDFPNKFIFFNDEYYEIEKLTYDIPIDHCNTELKVEQDGNACLFVKNANGTVDKLLTDVQLKNVKFVDGEVINYQK